MTDTKGPTHAGIHALTRIGMQTATLHDLEAKIREDIGCARLEGCSWRLIGLALDITTQTAWEKYRTVHPEKPSMNNVMLPMEESSEKWRQEISRGET